jgi:hypothetical protein
MKQHEILAKEVLSRLYVWNLAASINKCEFHIDTVKFLGYIISRDSITMSEKNIEVIRSWESLKT